MEALAYTLKILINRKKQLFSWLVLMIIYSVIVISPSILIGKMIDIGLPSNDFKIISFFISGIVLSVLLSSFFQASSTLYLEKLVSLVIKDIKIKMFINLQRKKISDVISIGYDSLYQRVTDSIDNVKENLFLIMKDILSVSISTGICIYFISQIDILIPFLFLMVYIPYIYIRIKVFKSKGYLVHKQANTYSGIIQTIREQIQGVRLIKLTNSEQSELEKLHDRQKENIDVQVEYINYFSYLVILNTFLNLIPEIIVYAYLGYKVIEGQSSIGDIIIIVGLLAQIRTFVWQVSRFNHVMNKYKIHLNRLTEIEQLPAEQYSNNGVMTDFNGDIEFNNITFEYNNQRILNDFSLGIRSGTSIGIVGLSGVGKTTLANLLIGIEKPQNGTIKIDGIPLEEINIDHFRKNVSFITQYPYLINSTIRNNVSYGLDDINDDVIWRALEFSDLSDLVKGLEHGLDTVIGENGIQLSGGQKQRLSISRAYIANPKILILDEATASLDLESEHHVQLALEKLQKITKSIVIAHRLSTLRNVDEIIVLNEGDIIERGNYKKLMDAKGFYYNLFMEQYNIKNEEVKV